LTRSNTEVLSLNEVEETERTDGELPGGAPAPWKDGNFFSFAAKPPFVLDSQGKGRCALGRKEKPATSIADVKEASLMTRGEAGKSDGGDREGRQKGDRAAWKGPRASGRGPD